MARFWQRTRNWLTAPTKYIQTTDSVSRPMAVLMSLLAVFGIIAIMIGIFFVGTWGYDQIAGKSSKPANPVSGISKPSEPAIDKNPSSGNSTTPSAPSGNSTAGQNQTSVAPTATNQSSANSGVPNTGPGNLFGLFIAASIIGALAHKLYLYRRRTY